jgi:ribonuclease J
MLECAKENGRKLVISAKHAYFLNQLRTKNIRLPRIDSQDFLIFRRAKKWYFKWEQEVLGLSNVISAQQVQKMQDKVILASSFSDLRELIDIRPEPGSTFINSSSEPFNEEMDLEHDRLVNWLDHLGLPMYQIHCSGHIMPDEAKDVIMRIQPKKLLPIHTAHPTLFAKFVSNLTSVEVPQTRKPHELAE